MPRVLPTGYGGGGWLAGWLAGWLTYIHLIYTNKAGSFIKTYIDIGAETKTPYVCIYLSC
jgi:hypothetical protein